MCDGDFDPPGWRLDRDDFNGEGNAGCALFIIGAFVFVTIATICGC